ncbi:MAG: dTDP-4-dehydrorhamnose reductase, partial [Deltaproteobacteria bacterium]|nr:dTDP-4-dehydrorhamnose reductase [Deltaproteobacteria bacterium]
CETEREAARQVNVQGPENLAASAKRHGVFLVHVSTDYVFDGNKPVPEAYTEADTPSPISYYGKTKLEGEMAIQRICPDHAIVRTAWLYGGSGPNILKTFLRRALSDPAGEIRVVNDQYGSPTWSYRLALQMARLIEAKGHGVYHATSQGYCTWYDLACYFLNLMDVPHRVVPCSTAEYPTAARRPKNSILDNSGLKARGIDLMPRWEDDLNAFVARYRSGLIQEVQEQGTP